MKSEIWLEIRDEAGAQQSGKRTLAWRFQVKSRAGSAAVRFTSPLTENTTRLVREYVRDFCSFRPKQRDWGLTAERTLLNLGRALGDALVDSEYQLLTFCELLASAGESELHVAVLADDPEFHELPWELLILPDSAYVLAAVSAAFVRAASDSDPLESTPRTLGLDHEHPLGYLRIGAGRPAQPSALLSTAWKQSGWQGALRYRYVADLASADPAVEDARGPHHVVHWAARDGEPLGAAATALVDRARKLGAELLIVEPSEHDRAVHELALAALEAGIDNVVVLAEPTREGWPSGWATHLLDGLRSGLSARRAVVETRKRLQRALLDARQAEPEPVHAAQQWHVLQHYSRADVRFFDTSIQPVAHESTEAHAAVRGDLLGFETQLLPGQVADLGDAAVLALHDELQSGRAVVVTAAHGGGLTHALHRLALFARANSDVSRAYYWDFEREAYTPDDMLEMIDGSRGQTDRQLVSERRVLEVLGERRELFVFDNLDALAREQHPALLDFIARLAAAGGLCVLGTHAALSFESREDAFKTLRLQPLTELESVAMVDAIAPAAFGLGAALPALLPRLRGNPLLIARVLPHCNTENVAALQAELRELHEEGDATSAVQRFHARRWNRLEKPWRQLLLSWQPFEGLYLQTLMIAIDAPNGERSVAARQLWELLGASAATSCADAIATITQAGFAAQLGVGTCVDRSASRFLREQASDPNPELESHLAAVVCEAVSRALERRHAAVETIAGHWLGHRAIIREQIDRLVRDGDYAASTRAFLNMHALLHRANLTQEASAWARAMLEQLGTELCTLEDPLRGTTWLRIAARADAQPLDGALRSGVERWTEWLTQGKLSDEQAQRTLLPLAVALLEKVYDLAGDFSAYREVARSACEVYRRAGNQLALVPQLRALAAAEHVLGNLSERDRIEHELVSELDYATLSDGAQLRQQTLAQIAGARLRRSDDRGAEALVEQIEREWQRAETCWPARTLRAELALARAQPELAAEHFCQLWQAAVSGERGIDIDAVARRLRQLEEQLGAARFAALYAEHAGSAPTPDALGVSIRPPGRA